jgi:hypothetical protein
MLHARGKTYPYYEYFQCVVYPKESGVSCVGMCESIMLRNDKEKLGHKSTKLNVILFICEKQNVSLLIGDSFVFFFLGGLIALLILHWWERLGYSCDLELFSFLWDIVQTKKFGFVINFPSMHNNQNWTLVCVYGPCQGEERDNFVSWLYNFSIPPVDNWLRF